MTLLFVLLCLAMDLPRLWDGEGEANTSPPLPPPCTAACTANARVPGWPAASVATTVAAADPPNPGLPAIPTTGFQSEKT